MLFLQLKIMYKGVYDSLIHYFCFYEHHRHDFKNNYRRFDERKSQCSLPVKRLGYAPVIAVLAALFCTLLALGHTIRRCLPPLADSFFIFNANEDNRLCIDPVLVPANDSPPAIPALRKTSIIPVRLSFYPPTHEGKVIIGWTDFINCR